ncbi:hypothetical protein SAMN04488527_101241 [Aliiroseovarius crassostreae]|uniref:Uncharacterized protein n=1 Tax=Aliiroseovarius crassostreae TaxID=154981 RepID=A0A0P7KK69_9RHOB|nr:hypothetical protein AKJ29_16530 [Aliiroseovarius crassostreae]SFU30763.1 hypothetical protein SAMN04488527_101241 [Aliiroseovarius crassostreae]
MWLFIPPTDMTKFAASAFVPVSQDLILDCTLQNPDIELCVMSSETVSPRPLSWRGWRTRPWHQHFYGTISKPSMADRGAAEFISSLPVIPANRSRSQGCARAKTTRATYGRKSRGSRMRSARNGFSLKMSPAISPLASKTSAEIFREWAIGLQRASYQRRKSAGRIPARGSSFWPTPTFKGSGNRACIVGSPVGIQFKTDQNQTGTQVGIKNAASAWTLMWELMAAAGWQPQPFRSSHRFRVILLNGEKYSTDPLSLNPAFTDWMMGWPSGWTDPQQPVTEWSLWLRRMRTAFYELNWAAETRGDAGSRITLQQTK